MAFASALDNDQVGDPEDVEEDDDDDEDDELKEQRESCELLRFRDLGGYDTRFRVSVSCCGATGLGVVTVTGQIWRSADDVPTAFAFFGSGSLSSPSTSTSSPSDNDVREIREVKEALSIGESWPRERLLDKVRARRWRDWLRSWWMDVLSASSCRNRASSWFTKDTCSLQKHAQSIKARNQTKNITTDILSHTTAVEWLIVYLKYHRFVFTPPFFYF